MKAPQRIRRMSIAAVTVLCSMAATPALGAAALRLAWSREYGAETNVWYAHRTAAVAGETIVVGGQREPRPGTNTEGWLLEVDQNGEVVAQRTVGSQYATVRALSPDATYAVVVAASGQSALLRRADARYVTAAADMAPGQSAVLVQLTKLAGGVALAVGHDERGALAIALGADGKPRWQKRPEGVPLQAFVDAAAGGDGGFVLVGNTRLAAPVPADIGAPVDAGGTADPPSVWLGKYDAGGTRIAERSFPGRHGSIVRARDGGYALAYDRGRGERQDIVVQRLSEELGDLWSAPVFSAEAGYQYFRIAGLASGDFAVAGGKDDQPYVALVSGGGQRLAEFVGSDLLRSPSYEVVTAGDVIFVVSTVFVEFTAGGKRDAAQKVRVMRMEPSAT
jgi:hypothetical protein